MRIFKLIGMALLAIVLCMNFVSCSDDEPDSNKNQKHITQIIESFINSGEKRITTLEYDADGNLTGLDEDGEYYENITYSDNQISITCHDMVESLNGTWTNRSWTNKYYLNAGRIIQSEDGYDGDIYIYKYDDKNQLVEQIRKSKSGQELVVKYMWNNGNIIKYEFPVLNGGYVYASTIYTYTNIPSTKGLSLAGLHLRGGFYNNYTAEILYRKGYLGVYPKNLVSTFITYNNDNTEKINIALTYSFNNNGYMSNINAKNLIDEESDENCTVKVIWE